MAGYIMSLGQQEDALESCFNSGAYGTILNFSRNIWDLPKEGTLADYASMKEGDNIYFFKKRKIYGVGRLVNISGDCKFFNFPQAYIAGEQDYNDIKEDLLLDVGEGSEKIRVICMFEPYPLFFQEGIDMDEALSSNPKAFKMLRAFERLSFIKVDDEENKALFDIILKVNEKNYINNENHYGLSYVETHSQIQNKLVDNDNYNFKVENILNTFNNDGLLRHEMGLELGILHQLINNDQGTINILEKWDYLSHQVIASPFKPIIYVDKIDIFGYSYIRDFKTINKYLIAELKSETASIEDIEQLLKYVDFVNQEYSSGDYNMIKAFLIAHAIPQEVVDYRDIHAKRMFSYGTRPAKSKEWSSLELIEYYFDENTGLINLTKV